MENRKDVNRCKWCTNDPIYQAYHDNEWGVPRFDDQILFEMLILEGAQAGLSWITILKRRENYKQAFEGFNVDKVANYGSEEVDRLLNDSSIIRNKLKIKSAIRNAQVFKQIQNEYGHFSRYIWEYVGGRPIVNSFISADQVPVTSQIAIALSKDLKKRGMSFVGPIIMYSYMQSIGMVNDHTLDCFIRKK